MKNEIIIFEKENIRLEVDLKEDTVWLTQKQMAELFGKSRNTVTEHISNIFKEKELDEKCNVGKTDIPNSDKPVKIYSLDVVISVGYRVKSKRGTAFRIWANKILKDHLIKGYTVNEERLKYLEKTVKLLDIATRTSELSSIDETKRILKVINDYSNSLNLLDEYDHREIKKPKGTKNGKTVTYGDCLEIISLLKFNETSKVFALERNKGLESIINNVYQSFDNKDVYESVEEKIANFFYLVIKNHVFIDGNKRIAATLFLYLCFTYDILNKNGFNVIENNTLTALTLLIAQSNPKEKDIMIDLIMNFLVTSY